MFAFHFTTFLKILFAFLSSLAFLFLVTLLFYWSTSFCSFLRKGPGEGIVLKLCAPDAFSLLPSYLIDSLPGHKLFSKTDFLFRLHGFLASKAAAEIWNVIQIPETLWTLFPPCGNLGFSLIPRILKFRNVYLTLIFSIYWSGHLVNHFNQTTLRNFLVFFFPFNLDYMDMMNLLHWCSNFLSFVLFSFLFLLPRGVLRFYYHFTGIFILKFVLVIIVLVTKRPFLL